MGDGTKENPFTREDVLKLIEEKGGTADGLDPSEQTFEVGIDLRGLDLEGIILSEAGLERAHLEGAYLTGAYLEGAFLVSTHLERAYLRYAHLERAILANAHLERASLWQSHLEGARLWGTHLRGADLSGAEFDDDTKLEDVDWGNYILGEEKSGSLDWAVATYRRLKVWYKNAGISDIEGEFLYREMTAKRKQFWWGDDKPQLKDLIRPFNPKELLRVIIPQKPFHWAWSKFLSLICGYGERPLRVIGWAASVIFGLAAAYYFWGSFSSSSFWDTLYYSAASFTALGYGQWAPQPTGWAKGMGAAEAFMGVFMIALFLVTFVRKWTR